MIRKKELMLLACLRNNARETLTNISKKTNIPISTIFDKLKEYEKTFIKKHTSILDFKKLGYDIRINMLLKVDRSKRYALEERTAEFGKNIIKFAKKIPVNEVTKRLIPQIVASGTSVGANY